MTKRRKPNYFRALINLVPALIVIGVVLFDDAFESALCSVSMLYETIKCTPVLPGWFLFVALGVVIVSIAKTCWAWHKDHVLGDYKADLMRGANRYRN